MIVYYMSKLISSILIVFLGLIFYREGTPSAYEAVNSGSM